MSKFRKDYKEKSDSEIEKEFIRTCNRIRQEIGRDLINITNAHVLKEDKIRELANKNDNIMSDKEKIRSYISEVGCPICEKDGKLFLGNIEKSGVAGACNIDYGECARKGGKRIGNFHTHPFGDNIPSIDDLMCSKGKGESIMCIGGTNGKKDEVMCYTLRNKTRNTKNFVDKYYDFFENLNPSEKIIKVLSEPPLPTVTDLIRDLHDEDILHMVVSAEERKSVPMDEKMERIKRFKKELKRGVIPKEYWDQYIPDEGEIKEFMVYKPEELRKIKKEARKLLEQDTFICDIS